MCMRRTRGCCAATSNSIGPVNPWCGSENLNTRNKWQLAIASALAAGVTTATGLWGWATESPLVLALTATPMFAILALTFGLSARYPVDDSQ